jgi:hypothetical protein
MNSDVREMYEEETAEIFKLKLEDFTAETGMIRDKS